MSSTNRNLMENKRNVSPKHNSEQTRAFDRSAAYELRESHIKLDMNSYNSRKGCDKVITDDLIQSMKDYFNTFFLAPFEVIKEIFSIKNNTVQHPICAFRGGCFICNEGSVAHLKDEIGATFLENKKIKFIKNANIFKLLDDSAYMEGDDNFSNMLYMDYKDLHEANDDPEYVDEFENQDNIESQDFNDDNKYYSIFSYFSDTDFEYSKVDYRENNIETKEIIMELKNFLDKTNNYNITTNNKVSNNKRSSLYSKKNLYAIDSNQYNNNSPSGYNLRQMNSETRILNYNANENVNNLNTALNSKATTGKGVKKDFSFAFNVVNTMQPNHAIEVDTEKCQSLETDKHMHLNKILLSDKEKYIHREELTLQTDKENNHLNINSYNLNNNLQNNNQKSQNNANKYMLAKKPSMSNNNLKIKIPMKKTRILDDNGISTPGKSNFARRQSFAFIGNGEANNFPTIAMRSKNYLPSLNARKLQSVSMATKTNTDLLMKGSTRFYKGRSNFLIDKNKRKYEQSEVLNNISNKNLNTNANNTNNNIDDNLKNKGKNIIKDNKKNMKKLNENNKKIIHNKYNTEAKPKNGDQKNYNNYNNTFCDICLSSISVDNPIDNIKLDCGHYYCKECIKIYIINTIIKLNSKNSGSNSKCPKPVCGKIIENDKIIEILNDDKVNLIKFQKCLEKIEIINNTQKYIVCPIPDCDSYSKKESVEKNFALCLNFHRFCIKCNKNHESKKCQRLSDEEILSERFFKNNNSDFKKCPKCATLMYKFSECNTNAVKCGYELCDCDYCWLCGRVPEKTHYTNPLSSCYKLEKIDNKHVLATNNCLRMTKYFIIVLLTMMIIPFLIIFSTFLFVTFFILAFVPDGSAVKHIKMRRRGLEPIFKYFVTGIYVAMAFPLVPVGYIMQAFLIVLSPLLLVYKKCLTYKALHF